jgi:hypothetical protein
MGILPAPVDDSYKIANAIMHVLGTSPFAPVTRFADRVACFVSWLAVTWTLAASGEFHNKGVHAMQWSRWAWWGNTASLVMGIIPVGLTFIPP